jgi:hypothetical protein
MKAGRASPAFYLSHAIELWAWDILAQLGDLELKAA